MDFRFVPYEPPTALRPILRGSFYARGQIPYRADKILPNGLAVAILNLGRPHRLGKSENAEQNRDFAHSWLHGVQTSPVYNMPEGETHVLGLLFEPIGFHAVFGTDMRALVDRTTDAREVLPADFTAEVEALLPRASEETGHAALHDVLLAREVSALPAWLSDLYAGIRTSDGALRLGDAYRKVGLSPRHINARFKLAVGVSPKVLCRIYRLQALLENIDPSREVIWADLAHRFGFADQAHFNHEFRRFSGLRPGEYLAQRRRDLPRLGKGESVSFAPQR